MHYEYQCKPLTGIKIGLTEVYNRGQATGLFLSENAFTVVIRAI